LPGLPSGVVLVAELLESHRAQKPMWIDLACFEGVRRNVTEPDEKTARKTSPTIRLLMLEGCVGNQPPPRDTGKHPNEFSYATELVSQLSRQSFCFLKLLEFYTSKVLTLLSFFISGSPVFLCSPTPPPPCRHVRQHIGHAVVQGSHAPIGSITVLVMTSRLQRVF
jgi:hypothetical protein